MVLRIGRRRRLIVLDGVTDEALGHGLPGRAVLAGMTLQAIHRGPMAIGRFQTFDVRIRPVALLVAGQTLRRRVVGMAVRFLAGARACTCSWR